MPLPVQNPNATDALQRAYDIVGRIKLALDEVVVPVHVVGEVPSADQFHPEEYQQAGIGWFSGFKSEAAGGVGVNSACCLTNPADSGVVAVIHEIYTALFGATAPQIMNLKVQVPSGAEAFTAAQTGAPRDTRFLPLNPGPSACTIGSVAHAGPIGGRVLEHLRFATGGEETASFRAPVVLAPGDRCVVQITADDEGCLAGFIWTEVRLPRRQ